MCLFIAQLVMFLGGLYALIAGRIKLTARQRLEGGRARIAGLFLAAALPCNMTLELLTVLFARSQDDVFFVSLAELAVVLLALIGAVIFARASRPKVIANPGKGG